MGSRPLLKNRIQTADLGTELDQTCKQNNLFISRSCCLTSTGTSPLSISLSLFWHAHVFCSPTLSASSLSFFSCSISNSVSSPPTYFSLSCPFRASVCLWVWVDSGQGSCMRHSSGVRTGWHLEDHHCTEACLILHPLLPSSPLLDGIWKTDLQPMIRIQLKSKNDDNPKLQLVVSCQTLDQALSCLLIFCITTLSLYQLSYLPLKYICIVFPITLNLFAQTHCVPGSLRERRWGWEALMGKWASSLSPPLESSIKGLERWCRGLCPPPPHSLCFFFLFPPSPQQAEKPNSRASLGPSSSSTWAKHTTMMTSFSWNRASIHHQLGKACYETQDFLNLGIFHCILYSCCVI